MPNRKRRQPESVLVVGCGYVGGALGTLLAAGGRRVWGLKRHPEGLPPEVEPLAADVTDPRSLADALATLPAAPDTVVYAVAAGGFSDEAYRRAYVEGLGNVLDAIYRTGGRIGRRTGGRTSRGPGRFVFVSSTAVYGDAEGGWVDETTPPAPEGFSGRRLLEGERLLLDRARTAEADPGLDPGFDPMIVRFGGIYGPGRTRLIDQVRAGEARCVEGPPTWTNRIHRDDCAGALAHLLDLPSPDPVYLGVDTEPARRCDVLRWIARRLGVAEPARVPAGETETRRRGAKRCSSARLQATGYRFRYPSFREGYGDLIDRTLGDS